MLRQLLHLVSFLLCVVFLAGCPLPGTGSGKLRPGRATALNLIRIGEQAIETGGRLEEQGLERGALEAYQRAVWAFEYHQTLTGEPPLLIDDARESVARLDRSK